MNYTGSLHSNPFQTSTFTNGNPAVGHNIYVAGDLVFEANYTSGIRIFDVSNTPTEVAFFDTYPEDDAVAFDGMWSVYPFLPSGTILGSDLNRGLFLFALGEAPIGLELPSGLPGVIAPGDLTHQKSVLAG